MIMCSVQLISIIVASIFVTEKKTGANVYIILQVKACLQMRNTLFIASGVVSNRSSAGATI
jgi:hypothetical protein